MQYIEIIRYIGQRRVSGATVMSGYIGNGNKNKNKIKGQGSRKEEEENKGKKKDRHNICHVRRSV